jgi:hypothetical protein
MKPLCSTLRQFTGQVLVKTIPVKLLRRTALHHAEAFSQALFVELKPEKFSSVVDVRFTTPLDI